MANRADPDQLASTEANWSGSTLFEKAGYIWVQQDKGLINLAKQKPHKIWLWYSDIPSIKGLCILVSPKRIFLSFPHMSLCETSDPLGQGNNNINTLSKGPQIKL